MKLGLPRTIATSIALAMIVGCSSAVSASGTVGHIVCDVSYKPRWATERPAPVPAGVDDQTEVTLTLPSDSRSVRFGAYNWSANISADGLILHVSWGPTLILDQLYQGGGTLPTNQFAGNHGFTGLTEVLSATTSANLQYYCNSKP
jgi:hypothetical protein